MSGNISQVTWEHPQARCHYLESSFWRISLYLVIAGLIFGPLFIALEDFVQRPDPVNPWVVLGVSLLWSLFFAQFLFVRLKVDQHGISRRVFWMWDLWPWEAFADGSVQEAGCYCYKLPSKPFWRQRLILLIDDVLATGRTIRAAVNELFDYGRPARVALAVLADRGGRELPCAADYAATTVTLPHDKTLVLSHQGAGATMRFAFATEARA